MDQDDPKVQCPELDIEAIRRLIERDDRELLPAVVTEKVKANNHANGHGLGCLCGECRQP